LSSGRDGDDNVKLLIGVVLGALAAWLYGSERARKEVQQRIAAAPDSLQQVKQTAASVAATGAQRVAEAIDTAPLPAQVKDTAGGAAFNVSAAADNLGQPVSDAGAAQGREEKAES
jgi:hypothetical protein